MSYLIVPGGVTTNGTRCGSGHDASSPRLSPAAGRKTPSAKDEKSKVSPSPRSNANAASPAAMSPAAANAKLAFPPAGFLGGLPHLPLDLMAGALLSSHLKPGAAPALNPYLNYPRLKPGETLPGACRYVSFTGVKEDCFCHESTGASKINVVVLCVHTLYLTVVSLVQVKSTWRSYHQTYR